MITVNNDRDLMLCTSQTNTKIILDSGCSHHLTNSANDLIDFVANDENDSLNLGSVCLGGGSTIPISGYGYQNPFGRMLVVPSLTVKCILSVGHFITQGYKIEFYKTGGKMVSAAGHTCLTVTHGSDNLFYVISYHTKAFHKAPATSISSHIPIQCYVITQLDSSPIIRPGTTQQTSSTSMSPPVPGDVTTNIDADSDIITTSSTSLTHNDLQPSVHNVITDETHNDVSTTSTLCNNITSHYPVSHNSWFRVHIKTYKHPLLPILDDPLGLMDVFVQSPWYENTYTKCLFPGYKWYQLPPYIHLMMYYSDNIDLPQLLTPSSSVLDTLYTRPIRTDAGKHRFFQRLLTIIENDQLTQMKENIHTHKFINMNGTFIHPSFG